MLFLQKLFKCIISFIGLYLITSNLEAQPVVKEFHPDSLTSKAVLDLKSNYGDKKILPIGFEKQTLIALSYFTELKDVKIKFRVKNKITPLATRPSFISMFRKAKKRTYIVTISKNSISLLDSIILQNLNYNAQIGVLGHELSHIFDFSNKNFFRMCQVFFGHLSKKYTDHFEFNTDQICIDHRLGYQLLAWSNNVRKNLKTKNWGGPDNDPHNNKRERYMNPSTINRIISTHPLYEKW